MIKAVFFDFDGTLINTLPFYIKAYDQALQSIGFKFSAKKVAEICFNKKEKFICESLGVPEKTEAFSKSYFQAIKRLSKKALLFDRTIEILDFIKKKKLRW